MSRILSGLVAATFLLVLGSCEDDPQAKAISPTEPVAPVVSPAVLLNDAPAKVKGSSVCASYLRERTNLLAQLSKAPDDAAMLKRASSLAAVITVACN